MSLTYRFRNTLAIRQREEYMYTMLVLSCHTFNACIGKWKTSKQTFKASTVLVDDLLKPATEDGRTRVRSQWGPSGG